MASLAEQKEKILNELQTSNAYVIHALQKIDQLGDTGFSPKDHEFGHSLATQAKKKGTLSPKQFHYAKLLLKKHVHQLIEGTVFSASEGGPVGNVGDSYTVDMDHAGPPDEVNATFEAPGVVVGMDLAKAADDVPNTVLIDTIAEVFQKHKLSDLPPNPLLKKKMTLGELQKKMAVDLNGVAKLYSSDPVAQALTASHAKFGKVLTLEFGEEAKPVPKVKITSKKKSALKCSADPELAKLGF